MLTLGLILIGIFGTAMTVGLWFILFSWNTDHENSN